MKKFLTVLLVIAVMFTFSFSSAFAAAGQTIDFEAGKTAKELYKAEAYADKTGEYGITEAYKYELTEGLQAILDDEATSKDYTLDTAGTPTTADDTYNVSSTNYYAPEKATAKAAIEKAITDVKAATKATSAKEIIDALKKKLDKLVNTETNLAKYKTDAQGSKQEISFDDLIADYGRDATTSTQSKYDFYLPGYGRISAKDITETETALDVLGGKYTFIIDWFMDNEYRVDFEAGVTAMLNALVPVDETYANAVTKEKNELRNEARTYAKKYNATSYMNTLTVADLEGINTLLGKIEDFNDKYEGYEKGDVFDVTTVSNFVEGIASLSGNYFNQYYSEIAALPASNKLDDTKKAEVIALYQKALALDDAYTNVWKIDTSKTTPAGITSVKSATKWSTLEAAYKHYKDADTTALTTAATKFTEYKGKDFDASEENVKALEEARKLYDENVKNYTEYNTTIEAKILAAEHNKGAAAEYTVKDTKELVAYLNNATVKVTTNALGNKKIRVQARFDTDTYNQIVAACGNDYTINYQFYHKAASASTFKAAKVKNVNYITYTSKSLKKGTKYKFQCAIIIKDANGNVVATKDYKASTIGSRVCR